MTTGEVLSVYLTERGLSGEQAEIVIGITLRQLEKGTYRTSLFRPSEEYPESFYINARMMLRINALAYLRRLDDFSLSRFV